MTNKERAKIFMPFDALKGFKEALKEKEKIVVDKKILSSEQRDDLDNEFKKLEKGMMVDIVYYLNEEKTYISVKGIVTKIDTTYKYLLVVKNKIEFKDIFSLKIIENEAIF